MADVVLTSGNNAAKFICSKYDKLKLSRSTWDSHWKQVAEYVLPLKDEVYGQAMEKGEKVNNKLFDSIGVLSNEKLAAYLHGMLTNPALIWFGFSSRDPKVDAIPSVAKWMQEVVRKQTAIMNSSNFQAEIHEVYLDLCAFGTALLRVEEDDEDIVRYTSRPIYEAVISENHKGKIDSVYFEYKMTLDQLLDKYGDKVPMSYTAKREMDPLQEVTVIQAVEPTSRFPRTVRHPIMPYTSVHVLKDDMIILSKGGFEENPNIVPRFSKKSGEQFGRSPAMKALSDIKYCNHLAESSLQSHRYNADPAVQIPDDGVLLPVQIRPRGKIFYKAGSRDRVEPLNLGTNIELNEGRINQLHGIIKEHFMLDLFKVVENDRMTATEVIQRRDENLRGTSPVTGRLVSELLTPIIMRTFNVCMRRGEFPPIPQELTDKKLEVKYTSQLTRAQDSIDAENFMRAFNIVGQLAQINPEAVDVIDVDKSSKFAFQSYGAPLELLREDKEIASVRKDKQDQMQQQREQELALNQSNVAKNLSGVESV